MDNPSLIVVFALDFALKKYLMHLSKVLDQCIYCSNLFVSVKLTSFILKYYYTLLASKVKMDKHAVWFIIDL